MYIQKIMKEQQALLMAVQIMLRSENSISVLDAPTNFNDRFVKM